MSKIEKRVTIDGSIERLFTYVPEAAHTPGMWPGLLEVGEVERLPLGGVIARWIFKMTGVAFEDLDERYEPLYEHDRAASALGNVTCEMKWNFHSNTDAPPIMLDGDYIYWSSC